MNSFRKTALIAGVLILIGIVVGILSVVPAVESSDYLTEVFANQNKVIWGAFFQFTLVPIYISFALLLYPILRKYNDSLAIGFVGFRFLSGAFQLFGIILLPLFILLSQEFMQSTPASLQYFQIFGAQLKLVRDLANHVGVMLATGLGNLILFYIFYKVNLIPRWLSSWGLIGNILAMFASLLILFHLIDVITYHFAILTIPLVLQEIILAFWLIIKGFNKNPILQLVQTL